jgi:hypothetical protein
VKFCVKFRIIFLTVAMAIVTQEGSGRSGEWTVNSRELVEGLSVQDPLRRTSAKAVPQWIKTKLSITTILVDENNDDEKIEAYNQFARILRSRLNEFEKITGLELQSRPEGDKSVSEINIVKLRMAPAVLKDPSKLKPVLCDALKKKGGAGSCDYPNDIVSAIDEASSSSIENTSAKISTSGNEIISSACIIRERPGIACEGAAMRWASDAGVSIQDVCVGWSNGLLNFPDRIGALLPANVLEEKVRSCRRGRQEENPSENDADIAAYLTNQIDICLLQAFGVSKASFTQLSLWPRLQSNNCPVASFCQNLEVRTDSGKSYRCAETPLDEESLRSTLSNQYSTQSK